MTTRPASPDTASPRPAAEWVRVGDLLPWERNPKAHPVENVAEIARSIVRFGFTAPIIPWRSRKQVVAGHGRLLGAFMLYREDPGRKLAPDQPGEPATVAEDGLVPVRWVEFASDHEAAAYAIADNRLTEKNPMDPALVADIFVDLSEAGVSLEGLGYDLPDIQMMLEGPGDVSGSEPSPSDDEAPEADEASPPDSQPGQVYELGPHRLLCGDCRNPDDVRRLLSGFKVNLAFTSPPYASQRKYDESSGFKPIPPDDYVAWFEAVQANVREHLAQDGSWFVNIKEHCDDGQRSLYVKDLTIAHVRKWGWRFVDELCWARSAMPMQMKHAIRFKNEWEPTFHFAMSEHPKFRPGAAMLDAMAVPDRHAKRTKTSTGSGFQTGFGADCGDKVYPTNLLWIEKEGSSVENHSATFPVGLPSFFIKAYTDPGDLVYEPFMGSGTTMIASAKEGRVCRGIEISPMYCDVIRRRWTKWAKEHGKPVGSGGLE